MIKQIEDIIVGLLINHHHSGLSEEQLFNYVVERVGTVERPLHLDDYETARANLSERIVEREVTVELIYGDKVGGELKVMRLFLKGCDGYLVIDG